MKTTVENARNKREEKKQTNIKWNSRLFFQMGVITSLLIVFFIMQTNFEMKSVAINPKITDGITEPPMIDYEIDLDKPKPVEILKKAPQKQVPVITIKKSDVFDVQPDDSPVVETPIAADSDPVIEAPAAPVVPVDNPVSSGPVSIISVEFVPVYPGCESLGTNAEKVECMSSKINTFINKNFRKELLENLGSNETHRIYVNFKIDSKGYVTDVVANSHNANLKKEAQRVVNNLPTMKPGKQGDKNVDVLYTVPIVFKIQ
jgi:protein TonB